MLGNIFPLLQQDHIAGGKTWREAEESDRKAGHDKAFHCLIHTRDACVNDVLHTTVALGDDEQPREGRALAAVQRDVINSTFGSGR